MAIVMKENERLYFDSWNYNAALIMSELAKIIKNNGGRVKPCNAAIISNRTITAKTQEQNDRITHLERIIAEGNGNEYTRAALAAARAEMEKLQAVSNEPVRVTHTSYISFVLDGFYYYYQVDSNPFFDFHYTKTPLNGNKYSRDAYLMQEPKNWLYDCFFRFDCSRADIVEAANMIFNYLVSQKATPIHRDGRRQRVPNRYDGGYHYETIHAPERIGEIDF